MLNLNALSVAIVIGVLSPIVPINVSSESHVLAQTQAERKAEADRLLEQGREQFNPNQFREALQSFQQALEIYQEIGDLKGEADSLNNLGLVYLNLGEYQKAIEYYQQSLPVFQQIGNHKGEANSLNNLGLVYSNLGEYQKVLELYEQVLEKVVAIHGEQHPQVTEVLQKIGKVYEIQGEYSKAIEIYQQVDSIYKKTLGSSGYSEVLTMASLGRVHIKAGEYQKGINYLKFSLEKLRFLQTPQAEIEILEQLPTAYTLEREILEQLAAAFTLIGDYTQAIELQKKSQAIPQLRNFIGGEAEALGNLGYFLIQSSDPEAEEYFQQILSMAREIRNLELEVQILINLGLFYQSKGQQVKSIGNYQKALSILNQVDSNNRINQGNFFNNIGTINYNLGEYSEALVFYKSALTVFEKVSNRAGIGTSYNNIGLLYIDLGEYSKALKFLEQALEIRKEVGDRAGEGITLINIGLIHDLQNNYSEALNYYQQALTIRQKTGDRIGEAIALNNIGLNFNQNRQFYKAQDSLEKALIIFRELGNRAGEANTLDSLGTTYKSQKDYASALKAYQSALAISREVEIRPLERVILRHIGYLWEIQEQHELAITFLKQSINITESIRTNLRDLSREIQQSYTETVEDTYRYLAELLLKENRVLEAQRVLDLLKVQELEDYLKNIRGNTNTASGIEFYQPEQDILNRYNQLNQNAIAAGEELAELQQKDNLTPAEEQRREQLDQLLTEIKADFNDFSRSPEIRALIEQLSFDEREQTLSLGELDRLRDKLGELNAVLFYPLILEDRLELVITTPNSPPLRRTVEVSREEFNRAIIQFRLALQNPSRNAVIPAQKLYKWLFEPLEDDLKTANTEVIIYAPDGVLRYIPLVALHDGQQWLAQRFRVNNITAASLEEIDTQPQPQPKVLAGAFADESLIRSAKIGEDDVDFSGLPFAGIEVEGLKNTLQNTTAYVDEAFNLAAMKPQMNGYNVLHLATHAAFVPGDPSESFIVFGNGENPTLRDVENWSLSNVDLVVLSACETGLGGFDNNGEQILGLGYQFQNQGARAVVASLWQVDDGGTQLLMNQFYNALQQGNSKTEALQMAQKSLIVGDIATMASQRGPDGAFLLTDTETGLPVNISNNLNHPYYWASFILIGNGL